MLGSIKEKHRRAAYERNFIIKSMLIGIAIGLIIGFAILSLSGNMNNTSMRNTVLITYGIVICGLPYMIMVLPHVPDIWWPIALILSIARFFLAIILGPIATPICLVFRIIQTAYYRRQMKKSDNIYGGKSIERYFPVKEYTSE